MVDPSQGYAEALRGLRRACPGLTVIVDTAPLMRIHHRAVHPFLASASEAGVPVVPLDTDQAPRDPLGPGGDLVNGDEPAPVLLVSDTLGRGWALPRLWEALRARARKSPVALLHAFDRSSWPRSRVVTEPMRLAVVAAEHTPLSWTSALEDAPQDEAGTGRARAVMVPVLELDPAQLRAWADSLTGVTGSWETDVWLLPAEPPRRPDPLEPVTARDRVDRFVRTSSSGARALAVRLAQAPVNLPVAEAVQITVPRLSPHLAPCAAGAEIAEVLTSALMSPRVLTEVLDDPVRSALDFRLGVRRELLERFGDISVMRAVFHTLGVEFKDTARLYRWLSRIESGIPEAFQLRGEEELVRAVLPALTDMPGEYGRFALRLREALAHDGPHPCAPSAVFPPAVMSPAPREETERTVTTQHASEPPKPEPGGVTHIRSGPGVPGTRLRASSGRPAYLSGVPQRNRNFTGRDEILARIHDELSSQPGGAYMLTGGTGIGKTQIAVEFAYRFRDEYDLVWWIPSAANTDIQQAYHRLARHLGVRITQGGDSDLMIQSVNEALESETAPGNWLLIFDNVPDPDRLAQGRLPLGGSGNVLLTSQDQRWVHRGQDGLVVPRLSMEESVALLNRVCPHRLEEDRASAEMIAERLQHVPLALAQVGAHLRDSLMETADLLTMLQDKFDLLIDHVEADDQYPLPLAAAWRVKLEDLQRDSGPQRRTKRLVLEFIKLCAFFAPRPLSRALFNRGRGLGHNPELQQILGDDMTLSSVIQFAHRHSLAEFDLSHNTFQLHATFQSVVQHAIPDEERPLYRALAHRLLAQSDPVGPRLPRYREDYLMFLSHVMVSRAWTSRDAQVRNLVMNLAEFLTETGDYRTALELTGQAFESWDDNPDHLFQIWLKRGRCLRLLDQNDTALAEAERIHEEQVALKGELSDEVMQAKRARAIALSNLGDFEEAHALYKEVYDYCLEHHGETGDLTLVAAHSYATILQRRSQFAEALEVDLLNTERNRYVYGENGVDTLRSRMSAGRSLIALGRYGEAREVLEDCLRRFEAIGDADSTHNLSVPLMLAVVHRRFGEHERALELTTQALAAHASYHQPDTRQTLYCRSIHMVSLAFRGRVDEAEQEAEKVMDAVAPLYREYHPFPAVTKINAGIALRAAGRYGRALELDRAALSVLRQVYGDSRITTLPALINIGNDLFGLGRVSEALRQDREAEEMCRSSLDPDHLFLMIARRNHLITRRALGEEVESQWQEFRRECADAYGVEHVYVTTMDEFRRLECDIMPVAY